jgi:hypothetical protein
MNSRPPILFLLFVVGVVTVVGAQDPGDVDYVDECPVDNGFFADAVQCDRYYQCKNSTVGGNFNNIHY